MDVISEFPGDSNDDDPNKKAQEDESEKKPQELDNGIPFPIPDDIALIFLAHLGRLHYPSASIVCRDLGRLTKLDQLYAKRSILGNTEAVYYVLIGFPPEEQPRWYILNRNSRLGQVSSLPLMPLGSAVVTIGFEIYVFGGKIGKSCTSKAIVIDCRFNTTRVLPRMRRARYHPVAEVIDGKIYVIGGCEMREPNWVEVFDVETEIWSDVPGPNVRNESGLASSVVFQEKKTILIFDPPCCFSYKPGGVPQWKMVVETDMIHLCQRSSCIVGDMLCAIDAVRYLNYPIIWLDTKQDRWKPVRGVNFGEGEFDMPPNLYYYESKMTSVDGKLEIFASAQSPVKEIWRIVIALKKVFIRVGFWDVDQARGKVVKVERVFTSSQKTSSPCIEHCRTVRV